MEAALAAGFDQVTLLEEPQAALYAWIERSQGKWREQVKLGDVILVVDLGGGTTDFSLIAVSEDWKLIGFHTYTSLSENSANAALRAVFRRYAASFAARCGLELAEQMGWTLPDAILYPTGGGVGLIGMWKAFEEMEVLGWIDAGKRPKMICVQAEGCAPIPKALQEGEGSSKMWPDAHTLAAGLRVPKAYADYIILDILKASGGTAIAVDDGEIVDAVFELASTEGIFAAPEGAASLVGYRKLIAAGFLKPSDRVVLFNTGSGLKYIDVIAGHLERGAPVPAVNHSRR